MQSVAKNSERCAMKNPAIDVVEEAETIEKISEMIAKNSNDSNANFNPKTKKQLQIILSRNNAEQNGEGSVENKSSNCFVPQKVRLLQNKDGSSLYFHGKSATTISKEHTEEVENKLEKMFAGIEDQYLISKSFSSEIMNHNLNEKGIKVLNVEKKYIMPLTTDCQNCDLNTSHFNSSIITLKSSGEFNNNEDEDQMVSTALDKKNISNTERIERKKLTFGMNSKPLKFDEKPEEETNFDLKSDGVIMEGRISSNSLNSQEHKYLKKFINDTTQSKMKRVNRRNCAEYEGEVSYLKHNSRTNIKKKPKLEQPSRTKQKQQRIKQRRSHSLLSSDNESEERLHYIRDIENKHRSPFVVVKNNGIITVVNTVLSDDSNEKYNRCKKINSYGCERKPFKGCHSSTLSNRYDSDTADSSWICVFCKKGPHRKGLGDLFGPYIITTNCDEYRSIKDSKEKFQRMDVSLLTTDGIYLPDKSTTLLSDIYISNNPGISVCDEEHQFNYNLLGMSKISNDCYEIWIHEECTVWAPNIFVVGSRLVGLDDATWNSTRYECAYCTKPGALLCCLQRDCKTTAHVPCARNFNWLMDETNFWTHCNKHAVNKT